MIQKQLTYQKFYKKGFTMLKNSRKKVPMLVHGVEYAIAVLAPVGIYEVTKNLIAAGCFAGLCVIAIVIKIIKGTRSNSRKPK